MSHTTRKDALVEERRKPLQAFRAAWDRRINQFRGYREAANVPDEDVDNTRYVDDEANDEKNNIDTDDTHSNSSTETLVLSSQRFPWWSFDRHPKLVLLITLACFLGVIVILSTLLALSRHRVTVQSHLQSELQSELQSNMSRIATMSEMANLSKIAEISHRPESPPDRAVVLASYQAQNVKWATTVPTDWRVYRYLMDDSTTHFYPTTTDNSTYYKHLTPHDRTYKHTYTVPRNQGNEAMAYLTFIIDHYSRLPLFTAFLHGHDTAWHQQNHASNILRALNLTAVAADGYANLRCSDKDGCANKDWEDLSRGPEGMKGWMLKPLPAFWSKIVFPDGPPPPKRLQCMKAAQFVATRAQIRSRPLEFWKALRRPLERDMDELNTVLPELAGVANRMGRNRDWIMGLQFEWMWHAIMGKGAVFCPKERFCRQTVFSGALSCTGYARSVFEAVGWKDRFTCRVDEKAMGRARGEQEEAVRRARAAREEEEAIGIARAAVA